MQKKVSGTLASAMSSMANIKNAIAEKLHETVGSHHAEILDQRSAAAQIVRRAKLQNKKNPNLYLKTHIPGFDELITNGIPKGNAVIIAGGAGSGKTIFCLQSLYEAAKQGKKCLYMSFEESAEKLQSHMEDFGWDVKPLIEKGLFIIQRFNPFDITRGVEALLLKAKGELLIDVEPVLLPEGFHPDRIAIDSLTAIASAFSGREDSYRIYIEQLFRFFEKLGATSFLITETKQIPTIFSSTGVEEFLADGVFVFYNFKRGNIRENACEVLKLRGTSHQKKIVAMQITDRGVEVFPDQEVFGNTDEAGA